MLELERVAYRNGQRQEDAAFVRRIAGLRFEDVDAEGVVGQELHREGFLPEVLPVPGAGEFLASYVYSNLFSNCWLIFGKL